MVHFHFKMFLQETWEGIMLFQVNGLDLAEIDGGEVGTTNLHSSNGPEFVLQLRFYGNQDNVATKSPGKQYITYFSFFLLE